MGVVDDWERTSLISRVGALVWAQFSSDSTGHDWWHIERVRKMALRIAGHEGGDKNLIELVALVHDVGDRKFHKSEEEGRETTRLLLFKAGVTQPLLGQVEDLAHRVSFRGAGVPDDMPTLEGKIVQDADRLDALGAIGIARTFMWGGHHNRPMYDYNAKPRLHTDAETYHADRTTSTLHHFDEKLFHLKERMHTATARQIAEERDRYMHGFYDRFLAEWNGKD